MSSLRGPVPSRRKLAGKGGNVWQLAPGGGAGGVGAAASALGVGVAAASLLVTALDPPSLSSAAPSAADDPSFAAGRASLPGAGCTGVLPGPLPRTSERPSRWPPSSPGLSAATPTPPRSTLQPLAAAQAITVTVSARRAYTDPLGPIRQRRIPTPCGSGPPEASRPGQTADPFLSRTKNGSGLDRSGRRRIRRRPDGAGRRGGDPVIDARLGHEGGDGLLHLAHHTTLEDLDGQRRPQLVVVATGS